MEMSQEGSGSEVLDENCKMSTAMLSMSAAEVDDGEDEEDEDEAAEENVLCYTFSADLLASGDIVDVTSNCVDMQGLSEAAVELMKPATIVRRQPNNSSLNLPSVVIHSASNTPKKKKRNTSSSSSSNQTNNNNNSGGGIPKRSKSFHISSQKKRKISFGKLYVLLKFEYCLYAERVIRMAIYS